MIYGVGDGHEATKLVPVAEEDRNLFCLTDDEILTLARWAMVIEDHYSKEAGFFKPMDIEWGKDGQTGQLLSSRRDPRRSSPRRT